MYHPHWNQQHESNDKVAMLPFIIASLILPTSPRCRWRSFLLIQRPRANLLRFSQRMWRIMLMGDKSLWHGERNVRQRTETLAAFTKYTRWSRHEDYFTCSGCLCSRCYPTLYIFSWHWCSCLALGRYPDLCSNSCFVTGTGSSRRVVNLKSIADVLGPTKTAALPAFHALTGADVTGSFSGKGKGTCWDEFDNASTPILQALANLVCGEQPDDGTRRGVEQLVCRMYQPKTDIKTVKALRWSIFKKNQAESERLPPTQAALHQAILRAHYQLLVWNNDHVANSVLPSPEGYGWQDEDGSGYQSWQIFHQLQRQLYSLSDASAPSPIALTTVVSVKKPDLSVLISVSALKIARTSMLRVMMSMMKTKSSRKFHRNGQQNNVYRYSVRLSWLYI